MGDWGRRGMMVRFALVSACLGILAVGVGTVLAHRGARTLNLHVVDDGSSHSAIPALSPGAHQQSQAATTALPPREAATPPPRPTAITSTCTPAALVATVQVDRPSDPRAAVVDATSALRNTGQEACPSADDHVSIVASDGAVVFECYFVHAVVVDKVASTIAVGTSVTDRCQWDQRDERSRMPTRVPAGTYTIVVRWSSPEGRAWAASATITLAS